MFQLILLLLTLPAVHLFVRGTPVPQAHSGTELDSIACRQMQPPIRLVTLLLSLVFQYAQMSAH
jgi:hypothetical protein